MIHFLKGKYISNILENKEGKIQVSLVRTSSEYLFPFLQFPQHLSTTHLS